MKPKILIVDDEVDAVELLEFNLKPAGFDVVSALDGTQALDKAVKFLPDLILLDLMLPEMDGLEVCKLLRSEQATREIPIIVITAKTAEIDRVLALEFGADDYLTKPFSPRELTLRIRNLLRRRQVEAEKADRYEFESLRIDFPRHCVSVKNKTIDLTATEFKLLEILIRRRGRVQSREQLMQDVWDYDSPLTTRTVDTHMRRLRVKLGAASKHLLTIRNIGYRFMEHA
jgi:two-component system phosphate regulon response regulator PhoB